MPTKRWKLVVTDLGGGEPLKEVATEGDNWMQALAAGRTELGETGAVPPGASCVPTEDGGVTVLDAQQRRRYVLSPAGPAPVETDPDPAPQPTAEPPAEAEAPKKKRPARQTVAYMPSPVPEQGPASNEATSKKAANKTMAYIPPPTAEAGGEAAPETTGPKKEVVVGEPARGGPAKQEDPSNTRGAQPKEAPPEQAGSPPAAEPGWSWELLSHRDEEPSDDNPLRYRERIFVVPEGTGREQAEEILRERFTELQQQMRQEPAGKFFNLAVFDHRWEDQPDRPPLVTLQWKDWRGEPVVEHPAVEHPASEPAPSPPRTVSRPPRSRSAEHDARLAHAFEACQDLLFLSSPVEGVQFVIRLLGELVPSEAATGCLYDIDEDAQRVVAASGPGSEAVRARGLPAQAGLVGTAPEDLSRTLRVDDLAAEGRFDPEVEGRQGLEARNALYAPLVFQEQLVGLIQLLNRAERESFSDSDVEVVAYVAGQLAEFVVNAR